MPCSFRNIAQSEAFINNIKTLSDGGTDYIANAPTKYWKRLLSST